MSGPMVHISLPLLELVMQEVEIGEREKRRSHTVKSSETPVRVR